MSVYAVTEKRAKSETTITANYAVIFERLDALFILFGTRSLLLFKWSSPTFVDTAA